MQDIRQQGVRCARARSRRCTRKANHGHEIPIGRTTMHLRIVLLLLAPLAAACSPADSVPDAAASAAAEVGPDAPLLDFTAPRLRSDDVIDFQAAYQGRTVLAVNTASRCGFTPQFEQLETLYQKYRERGLSVVGFPSNDFRQEHAEADDIAEVCYVNYGVTFDMLAESSVRGDNANVFFKRLEAATGRAPTWNFNKYLISPDGRVEYFDASSEPLGGALEQAIISAVGA